jgi:hypothetical protein
VAQRGAALKPSQRQHLQRLFTLAQQCQAVMIGDDNDGEVQ